MGVTKTEYIDREKVKTLIKNYGKGAIEDGQKALDPVDDIILLAAAVDLIPAAGVAEHGEWVYKKPPDDWVMSLYQCSKCGNIEEGCPSYCSHCGAKMEGGDHDGKQ